jgi:hypothetical protein
VYDHGDDGGEGRMTRTWIYDKDMVMRQGHGYTTGRGYHTQPQAKETSSQHFHFKQKDEVCLLSFHEHTFLRASVCTKHVWAASQGTKYKITSRGR